MKTVGIIAEYNPFHNGHAYQLRKIRECTGADYVVIAMSGDYVQRGEPAILDKYARTQMALENGADLVLELPVAAATASAEAFARGGVELLAGTGVIDYLGFGAETDDLPLLQELAHILNEEPEAYRTALRQTLSDGKSFPAARADALGKYIVDSSRSGISLSNTNLENNISSSINLSAITCNNTISTILAQPNNILAIEYLKALEKINNPLNSVVHFQENNGTHITPVLIPRIGDDYHSQDAESKYASATAIRKLLSNCKTDPCSAKTGSCSTSFSGNSSSILPERRSPMQDILSELSDLLPSSCIHIINNYSSTAQLLSVNDLSELLGYRLLLLRQEGYEAFADVSPELSSRISKSIDSYQNFTQFIELLKTKELTYTRIRRALLHIVLDIKKEDSAAHPTETPSAPIIPYLRILGFRRGASPLLHEIKNRTSLPIITKMADASSILDKEAMTILQQEIFVSDLYQQIARRYNLTYSDFSVPVTNELNHGLIIL